MGKRTLVIISLIISILTLVYLVLTYNGFIRGYHLSTASPESYIKKYKNLPRADDSARVVISFSLTPDQVKNDKQLRKFINSILDQTVRVDDIGLVLKKDNAIPQIIKNAKQAINVYTHSKSYGDANDLMTTILREPENNTKIIIVEPNKVYEQDFVDNIVQASNKRPTNVIRQDSAILVKSSFFTDEIMEKYTVEMGKNGFLNLVGK